jgi:site-specific DNA-methyltransferase (adenine-specific)
MPDPNMIHHQDCTQGMAEMAAGSVDLAFADPPFNIGYEYDVYDDARESEHYLEWSRNWIEGVYRVLKPTGTFWLAIGDEYAAELKLMAQEIGFNCRSWVIWYYTFGVNCTKKFNRSHAHLFHFVKNPKQFTFNANDKMIRVPSARQLVYADGRANPDGRLPDDTWILRPQDVPDGFAETGDTWYFPRVAGTFKERAGFHGCQMPEQLLGRIIRCSSNPDDLILDPFSGSATTMAVAKKLGRQWIGFDLSADYVRHGRARVQSAEIGAPLDGSPEPVVSAPATPWVSLAEMKLSNESFRLPKSQPVAKSPKLRRSISSNPCDPACLKSADFTKGIIEAFRLTSHGFSIDRVMADDELDAAFAERCERIGLAGTAVDWNRTLFRLRKSGQSDRIRAKRRTEFDLNLSDRFLFASEIALRQMGDLGASLDDVLCDRELRWQFDEIARAFAPGFERFQYRWGALTIRKYANQQRRKADTIDGTPIPRSREITKIKLAEVRNSPGLYSICRGETRATPDCALYVGSTLDLGGRLSAICEGNEVLDAWRTCAQGARLYMTYWKLDDAGRAGRSNWISDFMPHQSQWVGRFKQKFKQIPALNYPKLVG